MLGRARGLGTGNGPWDGDGGPQAPRGLVTGRAAGRARAECVICLIKAVVKAIRWTGHYPEGTGTPCKARG